jgi:hypothetical protein
MVTNFYPMVAEESSVANPQKVAKIDKKSEKRTNMSWQHCLRLKLPMNYPIPRLTSVISDTIGSIGYHWLSIGKHRWHRWETQYIAGHREQS